MTNDETPGIQESYSSAVTTSNMRVEADSNNVADLVIAAGWAPGVLGAALMRLHSEWDSTARRATTKADAVLLFGQIKSLPAVLRILIHWAEQRHIESPRFLAQSVAAHWLDSNCHYCRGRGKDVIPGTPILGKQCQHCCGTGKKPEPCGARGREALDMMAECVQGARNSIKRRLRPGS